MSYLQLLKIASPEAIVVLTALIVLTIGLARARSDAICSAIAAFGLVTAAVAVSLLPSANLYGGMLVVTPLTSLFQIICLVLALLTVLLAHGNRVSRHHAEYLAIILLGTVGLMLLVGSEELLMIFLGLELTGLSLYVLTAFDTADARSAEAGLKYFLFGSTASAFTLFGLSFVYGTSGTTALAALAARETSTSPLLVAGLVMTLVGFAFKIAAAPFHLWAPDTYQAAPTASAAFIASGSKVASFVVLGKILLIGFAPMHGSAEWHTLLPGWSPILAALAALSIILGNLVALAQTSVRRLLAYSAVAHAGYTLLGLIAGGREGFAATLFYTTIYAVTILGAFAVVGEVQRETGGDHLVNFTGLRARSPFLAACMTVFMLSLAGLPPLAGFFGKFYLFSAALRTGGHSGLVWLVSVALFGSLVSLYYYLLVLKRVLVDTETESIPSASIGLLRRTVAGLLALAVVLLGVMPQYLLGPIGRSLK
ncbi:MAG: NADH-quinone oxidoreductase subunit N [Verrucomicrobiota bacterium]|nr:NADH-quinone oxidoreductase subunit N [Verrucomicrobiota bacterium]